MLLFAAFLGFRRSFVRDFFFFWPLTEVFSFTSFFKFFGTFLKLPQGHHKMESEAGSGSDVKPRLFLTVVVPVRWNLFLRDSRQKPFFGGFCFCIVFFGVFGCGGEVKLEKIFGKLKMPLCC